MAISPLQAELEILEGLHTLVKDSRATENLCKTSIVFCHDVAESVVNCAAAAYTASIQHFERKLFKRSVQWEKVVDIRKVDEKWSIFCFYGMF